MNEQCSGYQDPEGLGRHVTSAVTEALLRGNHHGCRTFHVSRRACFSRKLSGKARKHHTSASWHRTKYGRLHVMVRRQFVMASFPTLQAFRWNIANDDLTVIVCFNLDALRRGRQHLCNDWIHVLATRDALPPDHFLARLEIPACMTHQRPIHG